MKNDSKEKILRDFNKMFEPHPLERAIPSMRFPNSEPYQPATDFEYVYRRLKGYSRGHGKPERSFSIKKQATQDVDHKQNMKRINKEIMSLWVRAKRWKKAKN